MILGIDTEAQGRNATNIIKIATSSGKITKDYNTSEDAIQDILTLATRLAKDGKNLYIYAHNMEYDYYAMKWHKHFKELPQCHRPFICQHKNIYFYDTTSLYENIKLGELGQAMQYEKIGIQEEKPELWKKMCSEKAPENGYNKEEMEYITKYCRRDSEIVIKSVLNYIERMKEAGVRTRRPPISSARTGILLFLQRFRHGKQQKQLLGPDNWGNPTQIHQNPYNEEIRKGYRGGRLKLYKRGKQENITYIDLNSLYPYCSTIIPTPDLRNCIKTNKPEQEDLQRIGVSKCIIHKPKEEHGLVPIRWKKTCSYPTNKTVLYGTWTHNELEHFKQQGCEIYPEETIYFLDEIENPFKEIMEELYAKRKASGVDGLFYKNIMNYSIGKFASKRRHWDFKRCTPDEYLTLEKTGNGWQVYGAMDNQLLARRIKWEGTTAFYAPIFSAYVNAQARILLHQELQKIPTEDILYCETDAIHFQGNHKNKFKYGEEMGQWKIVEEGKEGEYIARKYYRLDERIRASGIKKRHRTKEAFEKGKLIKERKITERMANMMQIKLEDLGHLTETSTDLQNVYENSIQYEIDLTQQAYIKDEYENEPTLPDKSIKWIER